MLDRLNVVHEQAPVDPDDRRRMDTLLSWYNILQQHLDQQLVNWNCDVEFELGDISLGCRDDPEAKSRHFSSNLSYLRRCVDRTIKAAKIDNSFLEYIDEDER